MTGGRAVRCRWRDGGDRQRLAAGGRVVRQDADALTAVSSATVAASSTATGSSLTSVTVTVTVAVAVPPLPSLIV